MDIRDSSAAEATTAAAAAAEEGSSRELVGFVQLLDVWASETVQQEKR